jgi:hypothetical protein
MFIFFSIIAILIWAALWAGKMLETGRPLAAGAESSLRWWPARPPLMRRSGCRSGRAPILPTWALTASPWRPQPVQTSQSVDSAVAPHHAPLRWKLVHTVPRRGGRHGEHERRSGGWKR